MTPGGQAANSAWRNEIAVPLACCVPSNSFFSVSCQDIERLFRGGSRCLGPKSPCSTSRAVASLVSQASMESIARGILVCLAGLKILERVRFRSENSCIF